MVGTYLRFDTLRLQLPTQSPLGTYFVSVGALNHTAKPRVSLECVCVMQERERERESYRFKQLVFSNSVIVNQPGSRTSCDVYGHYVVRVHVFCLPFNSHVKLFEVVAKKHKL